MEDLGNINFGDYLNSLARHLISSHGKVGKNVNVHIDTIPTRLNVDTVIPCGLILNELFTNALKYAFPDGRKGEIRVEFANGSREDEYVLKVEDNGIGMPEEMEVKKGSLGLRLVKSFVEGLSGTMETDRSNGVAFTITFREYTGFQAGS